MSRVGHVGFWVVVVVTLAADALPAAVQTDPSQKIGQVDTVTIVDDVPAPQGMPNAMPNAVPANPTWSGTADVSVCVPCIPRDVPKLEKLLLSIARQTVRPREVIIALSETSAADAANLQTRLSTIYPVIVHATQQKALAATNRNRAVARASSSIVSFFDADDIMHRQRIEIVVAAMHETHAKCLVHGFSLKDSEADRAHNWREARIVKGARLTQDILDSEHTATVEPRTKGLVVDSRYNSYGPQHGHPSCLRSVFREVRFVDLPRGQDVYFLRLVLRHFGGVDESMVFVDLPLTIYHPSNHPDNDIFRKGQIKLLDVGSSQPKDNVLAENKV